MSDISRWSQLFEGVEPELLNSQFQSLIAHYSEPSRHYHSFEHIKACLQWFDQIKHLLTHPNAVQSAIWFHDVIYDAKKGDNEAQCAAYAEACLLAFGESKTQIELVKHLIMLTKHPSIPQTLDEQLLLDIDLSILAAPASVYGIYEKHIRLEYQHVPSLLFRIGRKKLLKSFIKQSPLYHSEFFRHQFEETAKVNLAWALENL